MPAKKITVPVTPDMAKELDNLCERHALQLPSLASMLLRDALAGRALGAAAQARSRRRRATRRRNTARRPAPSQRQQPASEERPGVCPRGVRTSRQRKPGRRETRPCPSGNGRSQAPCRRRRNLSQRPRRLRHRPRRPSSTNWRNCSPNATPTGASSGRTTWTASHNSFDGLPAPDGGASFLRECLDAGCQGGAGHRTA